MTTFTDKELIKEIKERIGSLDVRDNVERRAYEIALASLEAEPVAWLHSDNGLGIPAITRSKNIADSWLSKGWYVQPLYIAKPVPVVPDVRPSLNNGIVGFDEGWNACRAVMLHGAEPVSQTYKLNKLSGNPPVTPDGWISCSERMPEDGQHVIILCDGAFVLYAQYRDGEFFDVVRSGEEFFETQSRNVTHWIPLPEPPQEVN
ncbi:DUF551 domain-containing protein [Escherichia coli]|jgi:hypothetical protein|uniref:DUF551 domain-containing protein n=1 Tax=Escherichia coli TaxID=562 RepID=UPI0006637A34|nr:MULTISPECIES: DUF551 domain-containing protein [Enterobacteriaceae]HAN2648631.1 DUF551 domain-containing protein [Escherichia coli O25b:H4-ST131]AXZ00367.1 DUF551 domain-containing protein [Escherichia coli]EEU9477494.1 DUF551 domain-containing protein [Escherichia coli]EEU9579194.1 DUF551 domain-containing protein [Escherichia coli]EEU9580799.1 DUF551 domain-containing protein [Escherichia coli]